MSAALRLVDTGLAPARWNVAVTAALAERQPMVGHDTLRFHRYVRSVLLGRGQAAQAAVDLALCRSRGVEIARRVTGGGAVYMGPPVVAFDLVARRGEESPQALLERTGTAVAEGLSSLGVPAAFEPPSAVAAGGGKICGLSGRFDGAVVAVQGSVLVDVDRDEMAQVLAPQLRHGRVPRIATVADFCGKIPALDDVMSALAGPIAAPWAGRCTESVLDSDDTSLAERLLAEELGTEAFVMGGAIRLSEAAP